jgi:FAS-associated factor 2
MEESRHLREEQDRAFREAEKRDRERMKERQDRETAERIKKERDERERQEKLDAVRKMAEWRRYARKCLLPPVISSGGVGLGAGAGAGGTIRVAMRTPLSSERVLSQFKPGQSTLPLFIFAETLLIPKDARPEDDPDVPPEGYTPDFDFRIVTTYPRKEIERVDSGGEKQWDVVKAAGGALFAESIEGGSWAQAELKALAQDDSDEEEVEDD